MKNRLRILLFIFLLTVLTIVQNSQLVTISFLFWSIEMSALMLMTLMLLIGFILGYSFHYWWQRRHQTDPDKKIWS